MPEVCGSAGRTGWHSGTSRTPRSVPSACRSISHPPCATWRSTGRTCGSRPTAGWCAWRATRRCDEPPPPARPGWRVRPPAPNLRPARAGGARLGRRLRVDPTEWGGGGDDARPEHRSERRGRAFSHPLALVPGDRGAPGLGWAGLRGGGGRTGPLSRRYAAPEPRITAGRWLAGQGAVAMIDVSDGLAADAGHLAAASGVRLDIELERIPCWPGVAPRAAVASGEEFELLVALPRSFDAARGFQRATGLPLTRIGRCARGSGVRLMRGGGRPVTAPRGFDHFSAG